MWEISDAEHESRLRVWGWMPWLPTRPGARIPERDQTLRVNGARRQYAVDPYHRKRLP